MSPAVGCVESRCDQCRVGVGRSCQARIVEVLGRCPSVITGWIRRNTGCGWVQQGCVAARGRSRPEGHRPRSWAWGVFNCLCIPWI